MSSRMAFQVGDRFGKLVILRQDGVHKKPCGTTERRWLCKCDLFRVAKYATEPKTIWIKGNLSSGREKLQIIQKVEQQVATMYMGKNSRGVHARILYYNDIEQFGKTVIR